LTFGEWGPDWRGIGWNGSPNLDEEKIARGETRKHAQMEE
jgi:hypothetical protein